ncbi:hypothetical protein C8J57DRAFT_1244204 [Mycena rebaudengoi]|nr:hypothetical protein C8J57DRAFT_1244204 [Mycena rebaudengoi]
MNVFLHLANPAVAMIKPVREAGYWKITLTEAGQLCHFNECTSDAARCGECTAVPHQCTAIMISPNLFEHNMKLDSRCGAARRDATKCTAAPRQYFGADRAVEATQLFEGGLHSHLLEMQQNETDSHNNFLGNSILREKKRTECSEWIKYKLVMAKNITYGLWHGTVRQLSSTAVLPIRAGPAGNVKLESHRSPSLLVLRIGLALGHHINNSTRPYPQKNPRRRGKTTLMPYYDGNGKLQGWVREERETTKSHASLYWIYDKLPGKRGSLDAVTPEKGKRSNFKCAGIIQCTAMSCKVEWSVVFYRDGAIFENSGPHNHSKYTHLLPVSKKTLLLQEFISRQPVVFRGSQTTMNSRISDDQDSQESGKEGDEMNSEDERLLDPEADEEE